MSDRPFIHDRALVETDAIGQGTRIWAFSHVMSGAVIEADCNICDHTYIEGDVVIGDRVTIESGVYLWDGLRIEDDVVIGPQATFTNDRFPRCKQPFQATLTTIHRGASIGAGAVTIGERAMVGAGAGSTGRAERHGRGRKPRPGRAYPRVARIVADPASREHERLRRHSRPCTPGIDDGPADVEGALAMLPERPPPSGHRYR